ncbi:MAG: DUF2191 domain-containing protein [Gammaproteobacteria bacterium]|nr:MAG: DUF2191 domain-containing protein [Gammaproteobacteria bacterium]
MKTTVDIPDELLARAKRLAVRRRTTLRAIIEQGIRNTLKEQQNGGRYVLSDKSVKGKGLQAEFSDKGWSDIRDATYSGRGS